MVQSFNLNTTARKWAPGLSTVQCGMPDGTVMMVPGARRQGIGLSAGDGGAALLARTGLLFAHHLAAQDQGGLALDHHEMIGPVGVDFRHARGVAIDQFLAVGGALLHQEVRAGMVLQRGGQLRHLRPGVTYMTSPGLGFWVLFWAAAGSDQRGQQQGRATGQEFS